MARRRCGASVQLPPRSQTVSRPSVSAAPMEALRGICAACQRLECRPLRWAAGELAFRYLEPQEYPTRFAAAPQREGVRFASATYARFARTTYRSSPRRRTWPISRPVPKHIYSIISESAATSSCILRADLRCARVAFVVRRSRSAAVLERHPLLHADWAYIAGEFDDY